MMHRHPMPRTLCELQKCEGEAQPLNLTLQPAECGSSQEVAVLGLNVPIAQLMSMMKRGECYRHSNVPQTGTHSSR